MAGLQRKCAILGIVKAMGSSSCLFLKVIVVSICWYCAVSANSMSCCRCIVLRLTRPSRPPPRLMRCRVLRPSLPSTRPIPTRTLALSPIYLPISLSTFWHLSSVVCWQWGRHQNPRFFVPTSPSGMLELGIKFGPHHTFYRIHLTYLRQGNLRRHCASDESDFCRHFFGYFAAEPTCT